MGVRCFDPLCPFSLVGPGWKRNGAVPMNFILAAILSCVSAYSAGKVVLALLRLSCSRGQRIVLALGIGLGILACGIFTLGTFSLLQPKFLWGLLVFLLLGIFVKVPVPPESDPQEKNGVFEGGLLFLAALCLFLAFSGVLAPEIAGDSLCYHLNLPKRFLQAGKIYAPAYDINAGFPLLMEMLYTLGLSLHGVTLAKFYHLLTGVLGALALAVFAGKAFPRRYGLWAAVIFFTTPGILNQLGTTYIDAALACYVFLAVASCLRGFEESESPAWFVLCGIFFAFALGIKFLALVFLAGLCIMVLFETLHRKRGVRTAVLRLTCLGIPAVLFSGFWYLRSFLIWGNPVYPYFYQIFRSGDPSIVYELGLPKTFLWLLRAPWIMTMAPQRFEGFGDQLGPAYLAFIPLVLLAKDQKHRLPVFLWCLVSFVLWFYLGQSLRFFFPVLPVLGLLMASGFGACEKGGRLTSIILRGLVLGTVILHTGFAAFHFRRELKLLFRQTQVEDYLKATERTYEIARWTNANLPSSSKILAVDEIHLFYFDPMIVRDIAFARVSRYEKIPDTDGLFAFLRKEGFTHILDVKESGAGETWRSMAPNRLPRLLAEPENKIAPYLKSLYTSRYRSSSDQVIVYTLYEILP